MGHIWILLLILYFAVFIAPAVFILIGAVKKKRSVLIVFSVAEGLLLLLSAVFFIMLGVSGLSFLLIVVCTPCAVPLIAVISLLVMGIICKKHKLSIICGIVAALMVLFLIVFYI